MRSETSPTAVIAAQERVRSRLMAEAAFTDFQPWSALYRADRLLDSQWTEGCRSPEAHRKSGDGKAPRSHRQVAICLDPQEQLVVLETWVEEGVTFGRLLEFGENIDRAVAAAEQARVEMRVSHPVFLHQLRDDRFHFNAVVIRLGLSQRRARRAGEVARAVREAPGLLDMLITTGMRPDELRAVRALVQGPEENREQFLRRISADLIASMAEATLLEDEASELRRAAAELATRPSPGEGIFQDG